MQKVCSTRTLIRKWSHLNLSYGVVPAILLIMIIAGCKKKADYYPPTPMTAYFNQLQVGKYITYRMDSLNFYYYGQLDTLTSYLAKDSVEAAITDNQGRPGWEVVRYLNDTMGAGPWVPGETYVVTPTVNTVEVVENNLRSIKLALPLNEGFNWTGNTYLPYAPYQGLFDFSDDSHLSLGRWNFTYQNVNKRYQTGNRTYDSTVTVTQVNDSINVPILDPKSFASKTYWVEVYARNIGLISRRTQMWEYQPPTPNGTLRGYKVGFIVSLRMVDHN